MKRSRIQREMKTVQKMIELYCRKNHGTTTIVCESCKELLIYSSERLKNCKFQNEKPTCSNCKIHCYKKEMQDKIIKVMRFSGPRMIINHPILAFFHIIDGL